MAPKGEMEQGVVEKEPEHKQKNQISPATPSQNPSWPPPFLAPCLFFNLLIDSKCHKTICQLIIKCTELLLN